MFILLCLTLSTVFVYLYMLIFIQYYLDYEIMTSVRSRILFLELLGIDRSRIISGMVYTERLYFPRMMSCSDSLRNPTEVRLLATHLIKAAYTTNKKNFTATTTTTTNTDNNNNQQQQQQTHLSTKKNLIILVRKNPGWGNRDWTDEMYKTVEKSFQIRFPNHNIIPHISMAVIQPEYCLACEIMEMNNADILVG